MHTKITMTARNRANCPLVALVAALLGSFAIGVAVADFTGPTERSERAFGEGGAKLSTDLRVADGSAAIASERRRSAEFDAFSHISALGSFDYADALRKSLYFYEAQRSGDLPDDGTYRVHWRRDSALDDGSDIQADLSGGWYDAGDHVKFAFPGAAALTLLAWSVAKHRAAYVSAGELQHAQDNLRWQADFFVKCNLGDGTVAVQCGTGELDHATWTRASDMTTERPTQVCDAEHPGSDVVGEMSAALAATALAVLPDDVEYAELLYDNARELFQFADEFRGVYSDWNEDAAEFYESSGFLDELAWASVWLYHVCEALDRPSDASLFLARSMSLADEANIDASIPWAFDWSDKRAALYLLLSEATGEPRWTAAASRFIAEWLPGGSIPYTPLGLAHRFEWGSLRYAANAAWIAIMYADQRVTEEADSAPGDFVNSAAAHEFAIAQLHYALGDGGRSFVVGFGQNPPLRAHHAGASCPPRPTPCGFDYLTSPNPNPHVLYGALVGGPDTSDTFQDVRSNYVATEVTVDYNAGFTALLARVLREDQLTNGVRPPLENFWSDTATDDVDMVISSADDDGSVRRFVDRETEGSTDDNNYTVESPFEQPAAVVAVAVCVVAVAGIGVYCVVVSGRIAGRRANQDVTFDSGHLTSVGLRTEREVEVFDSKDEDN